MELIEILKVIWQEGGLEWWRIAIICTVLALTATSFGKLAETSYRGAKVGWSIQGLEGWRATMVRTLLLMTGAGITTVAKRDYKNPFGVWLDITRGYIWIWVISLVIFGGYGVVVPVFVAAMSAIKFIWGVIKTPDDKGVLPLKKLWLAIKPDLPKKKQRTNE